MKIGILTQPLHLNYGGILQNWALQQVLKRMGHQPEMIFRQWNAPERTPERIFIRSLSWVKCVVRRYLMGRSDIFIHSPFERIYDPEEPKFADKKFNKNIIKTRPLYSDDELRQEIAERGYDAFIVGSDQVWREEYSPRIETFFLDFLSEDDKRRRVAYAASFGKEHGAISEEKLPECKRLLARFDAVSVREYGAIVTLKQDFDCHRAVKVLDPTLLLSAEDYRKLIKTKDLNIGWHIAAYVLDENNDVASVLDAVARTHGLPVEKFSGEYKGKSMKTISQWLAAFYTADFVITDSFHGCAFSILFHKPFVAIANHDRGLDRFVSLLRDAGLENRLVLSFEEFVRREDELLQKIDYGQVERRLDRCRQDSFEFLHDALA